MNNKFRYNLATDIDYEYEFAEIYYDKFFIAIITQEEGKDNPKIDFFNTEIHKVKLEERIDFNEFIETFIKAKKHLLEE